MEVKRVISKSKDGTRREVITELSSGLLRTRHIRQGRDGKWRYYVEHIKGLPIYRTL